MRYKSIPFTFEEWQKDPEGRKISCKNMSSLVVRYFPESLSIAIIWEDGQACSYSIDMAGKYFTLLIPVKTVRKWRNLYKNDVSIWYYSKESALIHRSQSSYAIESVEFDEEEGNYIKGSIEVEEI